MTALSGYQAFLNDLDGSRIMAFWVAWRMGDPITDELAEALFAEAEMIRQEIAGRDQIDRRLAALLFELGEVPWNPCNIYTDEELTRLQDIWMKAAQILRDGLNC